MSEDVCDKCGGAGVIRLSEEDWEDCGCGQETCVRCGYAIIPPTDIVGHVIGEGNVHAGKGCPVMVDLSVRLANAKERFEESMRPVARAPKPTDEDVIAWGIEFEAAAVRRPRVPS